ncbi:MAG: PEGA domain-containing protein, partial [Myxococcota bacterium]
ARRAEVSEEATKLGELFVTTEPNDLLIEVDGRPAAISPAKLQLPPGEHQVRLRRGPRVLLEKTVSLSLDRPFTLEADVRDVLTEASEAGTPAPAAVPPSPGLGADRDLDLVALVDRDAPTRSAEVSPAAARVEPPPPGAEGGSKLVVVWPGSTQRDLARTLRSELSGISVEVVGSVSKEGLRGSSPKIGAVMAAPAVLARLDLRPTMRAAAPPVRPYVAVRLDGQPVKSRLSSTPVGVLDEVGIRRTALHVGHLLGTETPPPTRRVGKLEDLLSLIQLGVVDTVIVERDSLPRLAERTQQELHTLDLEPVPRSLAVAFVDEGPTNGAIASALRSLSEETRRALGMRTWIQ